MGASPLRCCVPDRGLREDSGSTVATNKVELAATELFKVPGFASAYHTSIVVNGEEYFFSDSGIISDRNLASHGGAPSEQREVGYSTRAGWQLYAAMQAHFRPSTYDLVRKNCNSFSDCALHYLLGKRLDRKYSVMERVGQVNPDLLHSATKGVYAPNPAASSFSVDAVIRAVEKERKLGDAPTKSSRPVDPVLRPHAFSPGTQVDIIGLANAKQLNGQRATIVRFNPVNGRWEAQLESNGEVKAFRTENLRHARADGMQAEFEEGAQVRVHGLQSEGGQQINGQVGTVIRFSEESRRYEVSIMGDTKALKADNLELVFETLET
mmetsp:Transcript_43776/g.103447  ORF Transcript_43776/g.103447 Transcript_43776/m.103447 type:complete len:324 (+) Transcript_43776:115-1086(+)|eukprot:CAMPEP_0178391524 /NCGR_PEP_ID=MMETSP0689_2-20121128/11209_1 /TAXON_ID=160604 /ORGANISM="Amphidinium massartii, Strain CS-259" /LENGTH=323 /DNA_ID=CAMNT_0020012073 /DNA_START=15 /DNA_END=986 /DNA_ORIENTATION=-